MSNPPSIDQKIEHKGLLVKHDGAIDNADNTEMASIGDRVRTTREERGWSQAELARRAGTGVSQRTISNLETNRNQSSRQLVSIARALGVNPIWLESGRGPKSPETQEPSGRLLGDPIELVPIGHLMRRIPVVGTAKLGDHGMFVELEYPTGTGDGIVPFPSLDPRAYAVRCKGDSMSPRIQHGEFAVIEPGTEPHPGDEVLVKAVDGRVMIKRLKYLRDGRVHLESVNDGEHPPIVLEAAEVEAIHYVAGMVKSRMWRPE
jgi:phage repressor protein C with HTH and peptisase S24 domain